MQTETDHPKINAKPSPIESYCERIEYMGPLTLSLETLQAIHYRHVLSIPFENINPLLGIPVGLDSESLQQKLVYGGRGGYCFEQNLLLKDVLQALGFGVRGLAARVLWNLPEGTIIARGHMLLLVEAEGQRFIADAGFGGMTLTSPLLLQPDIEQSTTHEPFRLVEVPDTEEFILQTKIRDEWKPIYRFNLQENYLQDYEVSNYYLSTHPNSHFVTGLIAAKPTPDARYSLRNNELAIHHLNGPTERRTITDPAQLRLVLEDNFGITLPAHPKLEDTLIRLTQNNT